MIFISEYAFSKLTWFRQNCNENNVDGKDAKNPSFLEVSLMGISHSMEHVNYITDFVCIPQEASGGLTEPTDEGIAAHLETYFLDKEVPVLLCGRFWAHTHPGSSPTPSSTDEETFKKWYKDSDYGVMYILADNDDSCKVKNPSKYFKPKVENMDVYVLLEKQDSDGKNIYLSTKTIFSMNKLGENDGYDNIGLTIMEDYSEHHEEWMEELKKNVKTKTYTKHVGNYQNNNSHNYHNYNGTVNNYNQQTLGFKQDEKKNPDEERSANTVRAKTYGISVDQLIEFLINNNKNDINQLSLEQRNAMMSHFNIHLGDLQSVYNRIKLFEDSFKIEDLMPWEKEVLTLDGRSNYHNVFLNKKKLIEICKDLMIRPVALEAMINKYIEAANQPFGI